jgi:hypothetical protein
MNTPKSNLPTKKRIFSDVTSVSRGAAIVLANAGFTNKDSIVVSWSLLNRFIRDKIITEKETKQLILLELFRADSESPRDEIIYRLINYLTAINKLEVKKRIAKETGIAFNPPTDLGL